MVNEKHCKLQYCINHSHVMSCHVMSPLLYRNFLKNHFQKLFHFIQLFINISQAFLLALTVLFTVITRATPEVIHTKENLILFGLPRLLPTARRSGSHIVIKKAEPINESKNSLKMFNKIFD